MKPRSAKTKGGRVEKLVSDFLTSIGWRSRKQPGSGIYQHFPHDVCAEHPERGEFIIEVKARANPIQTIRRWMGAADMLVVKPDREEEIYILTRAAMKRLGEVEPVEEA